MKISELSRRLGPIDYVLAAAQEPPEAASAAIQGGRTSRRSLGCGNCQSHAIAVPESVAFIVADLKLLKDMRLGKFPEVGKPIEPEVTGPLGPLDSEGRFQQWRRWLEEDLLHQIEDILLDRRIFGAFRESVQPYVEQTRGGEIAEWIARNIRRVLALPFDALETRIPGASRCGDSLWR